MSLTDSATDALHRVLADITHVGLMHIDGDLIVEAIYDGYRRQPLTGMRQHDHGVRWALVTFPAVENPRGPVPNGWGLYDSVGNLIGAQRDRTPAGFQRGDLYAVTPQLLLSVTLRT